MEGGGRRRPVSGLNTTAQMRPASVGHRAAVAAGGSYCGGGCDFARFCVPRRPRAAAAAPRGRLPWACRAVPQDLPRSDAGRLRRRQSGSKHVVSIPRRHGTACVSVRVQVGGPCAGARPRQPGSAVAAAIKRSPRRTRPQQPVSRPAVLRVRQVTQPPARSVAGANCCRSRSPARQPADRGAGPGAAGAFLISDVGTDRGRGSGLEDGGTSRRQACARASAVQVLGRVVFLVFGTGVAPIAVYPRARRAKFRGSVGGLRPRSRGVASHRSVTSAAGVRRARGLAVGRQPRAPAGRHPVR